jgi:hypothetical protein
MNEWDDAYRGITLENPRPYGGTNVYEQAAEWVEGCRTVEDWGCGMGWMSKFIPPAAYIGVDGSHTPFADYYADLTDYTSKCEGLVMKDVLEHNVGWRYILFNAVESFTKRLFIAIGTPPADVTHPLPAEGYKVPMLSFRLADITDFLPVGGWTAELIETDNQHGCATLIRVKK